MCKFCDINPVMILSSGRKLCKNCFIRYFEKKVFKTIRNYKLIEEGDNIVCAISGGKDSLTLLFLLNKIISKRRDIKLNIYSYKEEFNYTLDELLKKTKVNSCTLCGVLRRYTLNKYAKKFKASKLATGHNLDDEAQSIIMNQMKHNIEISARLGPITGVLKNKGFIPRIKPLYFMTEKEVSIYSFLKKFTSTFAECPNSSDSYRSDIRDTLNSLEAKYVGIKYGIVNSFIEILPILKEKYKFKTVIKACSSCGEPCSSNKCKVCQFIGNIKTNL